MSKAQPSAVMERAAGGQQKPSNANALALLLRSMQIVVTDVAVSRARDQIPRLMREATTTTGLVFRILNAKNPNAANVLLISPETLHQVATAPRRARKLSQLLDELPFKAIHQSERLRASLPNDSLARLRLPGVAAPTD